jgi:hypothetical protein
MYLISMYFISVCTMSVHPEGVTLERPRKALRKIEGGAPEEALGY